MGSPCLNCPDRHTACWGDCEKYKAWKAEYQKEQAAEKERKLRDRESFLRSEQCQSARDDFARKKARRRRGKNNA